MAHKKHAALLAALGCFAFAAPAGAELVWGGNLETTVQADRYGGPGRNGIDLFNETEINIFANLGAHMLPGLALIGVGKLEQLRSPQGSSAFAGQAAYVEQLYLEYTSGPFSAWAGKIHPRFGWGWDKMPGLYGADFAEDYEQTERIGLGVALSANTGFGRHDFAVETYFLDTTFLSRSFGAKPARLDERTDRPTRFRRGDGGPSNTGDLSSFTLSLSGRNMPGLDYLEYRIAYQRQAAGRGDLANQHGWSAALAMTEVPLSPRLAVTPFIEAVLLGNAEGTRKRMRYLSGGAEFVQGTWTATMALTARRGCEMGACANDLLAAASLGYDLSHVLFAGLGVEAGYKFTREDGRGANTLGIAFTWGKSF